MREASKSVVAPRRNSVLTLSEFLAEFSGPTRFKSPLSLIERIQISIARAVSRWPIFSDLRVITPYAIPAHWQVLLNYLYREGVIQHNDFGNLLRRNDLPKSHAVVLVPDVSGAESSGRDVGIGVNGYGTSFSVDSAYGKAVGEALERFFLSVYKEADLIRGSYREMRLKGQNPLNIHSLNTFTSEQKQRFPQYAATDDSVLGWVRGRELLSDAPALIPAQHVYWSYKFSPEEAILVDPTTNAEAGHFTFEEAVVSALGEAVERDAFLMYWLNTVSPPVLDMSTFPSHSIVHEIQARCAMYGVSAYLLDVTSEIAIPACVCVIIDERSDEPTISIGAGSSFDVEEAITSSYLEALSVASSAFDTDRFVLPEDYEPFSGTPPIGKKERMHLWRGREALDRFSFFVSGTRISLEESNMHDAARSFPSSRDAYQYVLEMFRKRGSGYEVYCYEHKHEVLRTIGYTLVKVVVPRLMPLYLRERAATLDSARLREAADRFGRTGMPYNPWPHPFP